MAASLRAASTRIMRPAVLPGAGLRRLVHTQPQHSEFRASQFKQQKEELYDLIAKAYANSTATWQDRLMLHHLCTQIEPRPNDPQWRKVFGLKKGIAYTSFTGAVVTSLFAVFGLAPNPKIVEYEGLLVTAESVPMLQERLHRRVGHQPAATAGGAQKQTD
ncbi:hypothetical protein VPH35_011982 [Triticum aestivum]|uniref:uncharacterized protein n=1 Tax=Triticum aestivum TaxID=4565 RepID=UPI001D024AAA|nr:uncharacterized protein LOC123101655 [Triticum aestivum]